MGPFLIVLGFALVIAAGAYAVINLKKHKKEALHSFPRQCFYKLLILCSIVGIGGLITNIGYAVAGSWNIDGWHMAMSLIGGFAFYACLALFLITFYLRYWRTDLSEDNKKYIGIMMVISPLVAVMAFLLAGEGMAPYLTYPLIKGFSIGSTGFFFTRPGDGLSGGLNIQWYGVLIVSGAILAYKISDHNFYKKFGKHGILDTAFLIAFPAGILGARIWYVVGNWNVPNFVSELGGEYSFSDLMGTAYWWKIFALWEGGLTILGGAVGGIAVGAIYFYFNRKYADLRFAFDAVVPNILLAQAIGRFGNFFNREVYGSVSDMSAWPLVPTWVRYNMAEWFSNGSPATSNMYAPMFLVEAVLNVIGFFVITQLLARVWKKGRALGDCLGLYLIWYGVVRIVMEPMRDPDFNMGTDGMWSVWNALAYIIMGVVAVGAMHLIKIYRQKKGYPYERGGDIPATEPVAEVASPVAEEPAKPAEQEGDLAKPKPIRRKKKSEGEDK